MAVKKCRSPADLNQDISLHRPSSRNTLLVSSQPIISPNACIKRYHKFHIQLNTTSFMHSIHQPQLYCRIVFGPLIANLSKHSPLAQPFSLEAIGLLCNIFALPDTRWCHYIHAHSFPVLEWYLLDFKPSSIFLDNASSRQRRNPTISALLHPLPWTANTRVRQKRTLKHIAKLSWVRNVWTEPGPCFYVKSIKLVISEIFIVSYLLHAVQRIGWQNVHCLWSKLSISVSYESKNKRKFSLQNKASCTFHFPKYEECTSVHWTDEKTVRKQECPELLLTFRICGLHFARW